MKPAFIVIAIIFIIAAIIIFENLRYQIYPDKTNAQLPGPALLGTVDHSFDDFLAEIKNDIGRNDVEITISVGPFFQYLGIPAATDMYYAPHYYILLDQNFLDELTLEEKKATIAHEAGHILFGAGSRYNRHEATFTEMRADMFAARYVSPKHIITLLDKAYSDHIARRENLESLTQGK